MMRPERIRLRTYNVGFGDCFLLTFFYPAEERHVLIDFGTIKLPQQKQNDHMSKIARHIKKTCKSKLHAVVVTHRHKDHLSGFSLGKSGTGMGKYIADCKPDVVIQPWTEHPEADKDDVAAPSLTKGEIGFIRSLKRITAVSHYLGHEVERLRPLLPALSQERLDRVDFLRELEIKNPSAVENIETMAPVHYYVHYGSYTGLEDILPGVDTHILGPPSLEQYDKIGSQRAGDKDEFWMLHTHLGPVRNDKGAVEPLFWQRNVVDKSNWPKEHWWLIRRLRNLRCEQLKRIVQQLDDQMNNTSVILLLMVGNQTLLFPGDAQIENWEYALKKASDKDVNLDILENTTVYKVGHHGSRNATPKTLWNTFYRAAEEGEFEDEDDRLRTIMSTTEPNHHGHEENNSEVPRRTLVDELAQRSRYITTQELEPDASGKTPLYRDIDIVPRYD